MGKATESFGAAADPTYSEAHAGDEYSATFEYDLHAESNPTGLPVSVRAKHIQSYDGPPVWEESVVYFDGTGREALKKVRCLDTDGTGAWVGSGKVVYDNKGNPVKQFEPFFANDDAWETDATATTKGVTPILTYDALGRPIRTDFPDGSYSKVELSPWQENHWDQNDTVSDSAWLAARGGSTNTDNAAILAHADTPTVRYLDTLGRVYAERQDPKLTVGSTPVYFTTAYTYDIEGRVKTVTDARHVTSMTWTYDRLGQDVVAESPDTGTVRTLRFVDGQVGRQITANGAFVFQTYDALRRLRAVDALPLGASALVGVERIFYGESFASTDLVAQAAAKVANTLGKPVLHYDSAGLVRTAEYDFEGRSTLHQRYLTNSFDSMPDWSGLDPSAPLSSFSTLPSGSPTGGAFQTSTSYDALGRVVGQTTNGGVSLRAYNLRGLLDLVSLQPTSASAIQVAHDFTYNEKGQRLLVRYHNGTSTAYHYDPLTFRMVRQHTWLSTANEPTTGTALQDLNYVYDPMGNILHHWDLGQEPEYFSNASIDADWAYAYDPLYRLIEARGRETGANSADPAPSWVAANFQPSAPGTGVNPRAYKQEIDYDAVGNIQEVRHRSSADSTLWWTRTYAYETHVVGGVTVPKSNRLVNDAIGGTSDSIGYLYDGAGNMTRMPHLPGADAVESTGAPAVLGMEWDHANRLVQTYASNTAVTRYMYDSAGQRVRKLFGGLTWSGGAWTFTATKETVYMPGGYEVSGTYSDTGGLLSEWKMVSIMDDRSCVARVETNTVGYSGSTAPGPVWRYQLENHLGSSCLELTDDGSVLSREEYYPYGATAYAWSATGGAEFSVKRYRYSGKECDSENGLYYFGARYYAAWLGRWTAGDPVFHAGRSAFEYCSSSPSTRRDPDGRDDDEVHNGLVACFPPKDTPSFGTQPVKPKHHAPPKGAQHLHNARNLTKGGAQPEAVQLAESATPTSSDPLKGVAHPAEGIAADQIVPQRFRLEPKRGDTVTGVRDLEIGVPENTEGLSRQKDNGKRAGRL